MTITRGRAFKPAQAAAVSVVVAVVVSACAGPAPGPGLSSGAREGVERPSELKRIVAAIRGSPASLAQQKTHPTGLTASVPGLDALEELVHAGMTHRSGQGGLRPQLAEAAPTSANGLWNVFPDGRMETTWRIKPSAQWHDGAPLVAEDFLFATTVEQDRALGIPRSPAYDQIESIAAPDAATLVVTWKQPYIEADAFFGYLVGLPMPRHLLQRVYEEDSSSLLSAPYWSAEFVGAGAFRIRDWAMDSHVVLTAFEGYVLGRPKIGEIELRFIADPNTLMANVLAGVELTVGRALSLDQALQIKDQWVGGGWVLRSGASLPAYPQFINPNPAAITDLRFRRALLEAIDRQALVDSLMAGQSRVAHTFVSPDDEAYGAIEPGIVVYAYDPRRAAEAIAALGYVRGPDGVFHDAAGQRLTVPISATVQNDRNVKTSAAVANDWRMLGVAVDEILIPIQRAQDREYRAQFPGFEIAASLGGLDSRTIRRFHSSSTPLAENGYRVSGNNARYQSAELDGLVDRYLTTIPLDDRRQLLAGIVRHQAENLPLLPLFYEVTPTMVARRIVNVTARGDNFTEAWNAQEWDLR